MFYCKTWVAYLRLVLVNSLWHGPLTRYANPWVAQVPGCFPRHRLQRTPLVSHHGMHHGTCVTHVPWCMLVSLSRGGGENVPAFPAHWQPAILCICQEAHSEILWRHGSWWTLFWVRPQDNVAWSNVDLLSTWPLTKEFDGIINISQTFLFKYMPYLIIYTSKVLNEFHLKMSANCRSFYVDLS